MARLCGSAIVPCFLALAVLFGSSEHAAAQQRCGARVCPDLQSIIDTCPPGSTCSLPSGEFTISSPIVVRKPLQIEGAGRLRARRRNFTLIRIADGAPDMPVFRIQGDISVSIQDLSMSGGGVRAGGNNDPCRGIDDPFDTAAADLRLSDLSIHSSTLDGIRFRGGSLNVSDVDITDSELSGIYVAGATGDVVLVDVAQTQNALWGTYVCNRAGRGLIFINDALLLGNAHGGLAIVGRGGPAPVAKPACIQNSTASFNTRFGVLLYDVAPETLLFNVTASANTDDQDGSWGDGFSIANSERVSLWDVTATANDRAGFSGFGISRPTSLAFFGDLVAESNAFPLDAEGDSEFIPAGTLTTVDGCGGQFLAPPADPHCTDRNGITVACTVLSSDLKPPDSQP